MNRQKGLAPILIVILIALAIGGYLIYQKQFKVVPALQQTVQPSPVDETANWKTYTSSSYSFSLKYPNDWIIGERKSSVASKYLNLYLRPNSLSVGDLEYGAISVVVEKSELNLEDFVNTLCGTVSDRCDNSKKTTDVKFNNLAAKKVSPIEGALPIEVIMFKKDGYVFQFNMILDSNANPDQQNLMIRDKILSAFKFTQ